MRVGVTGDGAMGLGSMKKGLDELETHLRDPDRRAKGGNRNESQTNPPEEFANRVKSLRSRLRLTQGQFAERYGLPISTVRNWEQGRRARPDTDGWLLIALIEQDPVGFASRIEELT